MWFGARTRRVIPTDANAIIGAGTRLERYFQGFSWRKDTTRTGVPVGENTVVLFAGEDEKKGAVRLVVDGIKYQINREGNETTSPIQRALRNSSSITSAIARIRTLRKSSRGNSEHWR